MTWTRATVGLWMSAILGIVPGPVWAGHHLSSAAPPGDASDRVIPFVVGLRDPATDMAQQMWELAELGYQEYESSALLQRYLAANGFVVTAGVADIPTAFVATYGSDGPNIAILAEFDALPGLSQLPEPRRTPLTDGAPGHACGHHLFGAASTTAAVALARWLAEEEISAKITLVGTPAEEGGSGKVYLVRAGIFDDVDIVLHWHPGDVNSASPSTSTANKSGRFTFTGRAAHAALAPDRGRSALDGVEAMNFMVNMMREHIPQESRIHYVITNGGDAPNIVPETAQVYYYVRHPDKDQAAALFDRVALVAKAAALGSATEVDIEVMHGNYPLLPNETLARLVHNNFREIGGISYNAEERRFAQKIQETLPKVRYALGSEQDIAPFQFRQGMGSTDVGDVSWLVPTVGFTTASWVPGTPAHSWQAVAAGGMSIGHKGMMLAAKLLAKTGAQLALSPKVIQRAQVELERRQGPNFRYQALLGDRAPPLDYRR